MLRLTISIIYLLNLINFTESKGSEGSDSAQHQKSEHNKKIEGKAISSLFKRGGTCAFPNGSGMVAVQKSGKNAGWAMHEDQVCSYGSWCPYACEPGQLMAQWDPEVTTYSYPGSQNGGLYCDDNGNLQQKRSGKGYCYQGKGTVSAKNSCGSNVAFCQTVLPGNEEMLIPTNVDGGSEQVLAVPGTEYWAGTAAHYYINPPGVSVDDGCKWGSTANPYGNWAPYVAGANQDSSGNTYVKIGWNPIYLEPATPFRNTKPSFGIKVTCDDESKCVGLPCSIDPSKNDVNQISGSQVSDGAGGAAFCVVTAQNGAKAKIEVFESGTSKIKRDEREHHVHNPHQSTVTHTKTVYKTVKA